MIEVTSTNKGKSIINKINIDKNGNIVQKEEKLDNLGMIIDSKNYNFDRKFFFEKKFKEDIDPIFKLEWIYDIVSKYMSIINEIAKKNPYYSKTNISITINDLMDIDTVYLHYDPMQDYIVISSYDYSESYYNNTIGTYFDIPSRFNCYIEEDELPDVIAAYMDKTDNPHVMIEGKIGENGGICIENIKNGESTLSIIPNHNDTKPLSWSLTNKIIELVEEE